MDLEKSKKEGYLKDRLGMVDRLRLGSRLRKKIRNISFSAMRFEVSNRQFNIRTDEQVISNFHRTVRQLIF